MKNALLLCTALLGMLFLNACNKDVDLKQSLQEQQNEVELALRRSCGTDAHMDRLLLDADYRKKHEDKFLRLTKMADERSAQCNTPTVLPVAIHFQGVTNPDPVCLRALAQTQVDIINNDFGGTNADITNWTQSASSSFPGIDFGEACLKFCLASKNHPNGFNLNNGDPAVTINQTTGDFSSAWSGYLNIFVQFGTGVLGYSPLGGNGNGDGVVIEATAFSTGNGCGNIAPSAPYDLGRTLTHELGHYLLLDHIWGGNGGCNDDDGVSDTPVSTEPYYGCPNVGASSCSSTDLHMDYMDYTNDACMYIFTDGQAVRMENYVASSLQNLVNNAANVCDEGTEPPTPTCNDGIQNGQETGVDCGGPDCQPCEVAPTCNDGIQNGQETGVDCGGPDCQPCEVAPTCNDGIQNGQETGVDCGGPDCQPCEVNSCDTPINIKAEVLGTSAALVAWDEVNNAQSYEFQYREIGTTSWITEQLSQNSITITNLSSETTYEFRVRTNCFGASNSAYTSIQSFTTVCDGGGGHGCEGTAVSFQLILDDYGSETTWELVNDKDQVVAEGGPYEDGIAGTSISEDFCLEDGCYYVVVYDDYGDGICCFYGDGSFRLIDEDGNIIAESDGQFGYYDYLDFCAEGGGVESFSFRTNERTAEKSTRQKQ